MIVRSEEHLKETTRKAWALDSRGGELDVELQAAEKRAANIPPQYQEAESTPPLILRNLLDDAMIEEILEAVSADGVWPRGVKPEWDKVTDLSDELEAKAHHFAWTKEHVVLYMHNNDNWFVRELPTAWCHIRGGMEAQPGMEDFIPVLDEAFVGADSESMKSVRSIELHHYSKGGGLTAPGHRDCGSQLTISVLLSDPEDITGGDFVTYDDDGAAVAHKMKKGDAILFRSEKLHNIATITSGIRTSLVVELWPNEGLW